jgi:hypothetical protein
MSSNNYIANCHIEHNGTGIDDMKTNGFPGGNNVFTTNNIDNNDIGISFFEYPVERDTFYCNTICNNTSYGFKNLISLNTSCVVHNYWCTQDSASTQAVIYDVHDNINSGFVYFMPIDSACSPVIGTSINEIAQENSIQVYPNPSSDYLTIELPENSFRTEIKIFNMLGEPISNSIVANRKTIIDISKLSNGIYLLEATVGKNISIQKFIKQQNIR